MKTIATAVAALLSGVVLTAIALSGHGARDAGADASRAELERMAGALNQVQRDLRVLRAERASPAAQMGDAPRVGAGEPPAEVVPAQAQNGAPERRAEVAPPSEDELRAERRRYIERADRVIAAQLRDSAWNAARELPARVKAILPRGSRIESVTCGSTLCRVETQHTTMEEYRAFMNNGFAFTPKREDTEIKLFWNGPSAFLVDDDANADGVHAIAYLAREDSALP